MAGNGGLFGAGFLAAVDAMEVGAGLAFGDTGIIIGVGTNPSVSTKISRSLETGMQNRTTVSNILSMKDAALAPCEVMEIG